MAHKHVLFQSAAREKVLRGATALTDAVRVTLGPKSKSVLIGKAWGGPIVCNDGVTIAKEFDLKDPEENLGAQVIRQAAERTGDAVGDGTTTSTLLAHAIYAEGLRNVTAGASAIDLKRGLDRGLHVAVETIRSLSRPDHDPQREGPDRDDLRAQRRVDRRAHRRRHREGRRRRGRSRSRRRRRPRPRSRSSRGCSSIAATSRRTS